MIENQIHIRPMLESDLAKVAELSKELGYTVPLPEIQNRFQLIKNSQIHACFVALNSKMETIGWCHVAASLALTDQVRCEIIGLVVTETQRRLGAGKLLVQTAEDWGKEKGFGLIRVRSQALRESAHEFYTGLGYELKKIQNVFVKTLCS